MSRALPTVPAYPTLRGKLLSGLGPLTGTARAGHLRMLLWRSVDRLPADAPKQPLTRDAVLHLLLHDVDLRHEAELLVVLAWLRGHRSNPAGMELALARLGAARHTGRDGAA